MVRRVITQPSPQTTNLLIVDVFDSIIFLFLLRLSARSLHSRMDMPYWVMRALCTRRGARVGAHSTHIIALASRVPQPLQTAIPRSACNLYNTTIINEQFVSLTKIHKKRECSCREMLIFLVLYYGIVVACWDRGLCLAFVALFCVQWSNKIHLIMHQHCTQKLLEVSHKFRALHPASAREQKNWKMSKVLMSKAGGWKS